MPPAIVERLRGHVEHVRAYDRDAVKTQALTVLPRAQLAEKAKPLVDEAAARVGVYGVGVGSDVVRDCELKTLLKWFKEEFFTWVDTLPCERCGAKTTHGGQGEASAEDKRHGATRVEIHSCTASGCGHATRFPRYNDPVKLLETRRGRFVVIFFLNFQLFFPVCMFATTVRAPALRCVSVRTSLHQHMHTMHSHFFTPPPMKYQVRGVGQLFLHDVHRTRV